MKRNEWNFAAIVDWKCIVRLHYSIVLLVFATLTLIPNSKAERLEEPIDISMWEVEQNIGAMLEAYQLEVKHNVPEPERIFHSEESSRYSFQLPPNGDAVVNDHFFIVTRGDRMLIGTVKTNDMLNLAETDLVGELENEEVKEKISKVFGWVYEKSPVDVVYSGMPDYLKLEFVVAPNTLCFTKHRKYLPEWYCAGYPESTNY